MSYKLIYCAIFICGLIAIRHQFLDYRAIRFNEYLRKFNKSYSAEEYKKRLLYFEESLEEIQKHSSEQHSTGAVHGHTKFSDWSKQEFTNLMLSGGALTCTNRIINCIFNNGRIILKSNQNLPDRIDWRDKDGVIGPVQNQKRCSGCWAFGIVGVMEAMTAIKHFAYERLSVQELIDCADDTNHCDGGNINTALRFLCLTHFNITTEDRYPLMLINEQCKRHPSEGRGIQSYASYCNLPDIDIMKQLTHGPVMVLVGASTWQNYYSGIITRNCFSGSVYNFYHVVQIVGYDTTDGVDTNGVKIPYYIIKNSWGSDWGEDGYIRIARGSNLCGLNELVGMLEVV